MIDDPGIACFARFVIGPGLFPVVLGWCNQLITLLKGFTQATRFTAIWPSGCGISTFEQYESCSREASTTARDLGERLLRGIMPLIGIVPEGNKPYGVEEDCILG